MTILRNILWGIVLLLTALFVYKFEHELRPLVTSIINNLYISNLDTADTQSVSKFMDKYKKSLIQSGQHSTLEVSQALNNTKKLLQQDKVVVSVGYNLLGKLVGYIAVDLKTGVCIFYYILYRGTEFSKIYKNLLQNLESLCKKKGLKTLVIPMLTPQVYQEDIPFAHIDNTYHNTNVEELIIQVLQKLGYQPLQGRSKIKQGLKEFFVSGYKYDAAWSKNL